MRGRAAFAAFGLLVARLNRQLYYIKGLISTIFYVLAPGGIRPDATRLARVFRWEAFLRERGW
jgi:hypothetical protein